MTQSTHTVRDSSGQLVGWPTSTDRSRLYYEAHVTIPALSPQQASQVDLLCRQLEWRRSTFELHAGGLTPHAFVSCRDVSRTAILQRVTHMVQSLVRLGCTVLRYKVEDTLLDSKAGDTLLPPADITSEDPRHGIYSPDAPAQEPAPDRGVAP